MPSQGNRAAASVQLDRIQKAVDTLNRGGVVAFPTDTLYGLGADIFNAAAIESVFEIKERPGGLALPVLIDGWDQLEMVAEDVPPGAKALTERYWPGALTLVVKKTKQVSDRVTAGASTVAVRVPDHPVPRAIARLLGGPITGTSANINGQPDPRTIGELESQIGGRVDYLVTTGPAPQGTASTIVDITGTSPKLLREGAVPFGAILEVLG